MGSLRLFVRLFQGILLCLLIAGCTPEPEATPRPTTGESVSESPLPTVTSRSLAPAEAKLELEALVKRIEGLRNRQSCGGVGFQSRLPDRITSINLRAEFAYSCGCCTEDVCSEVTDQDIAYFGSFEALEVLKAPKSALQGHGLRALGKLKHLREIDLSWSPVCDDALVHLANLSSLETLELNATEINGEGLRHLANLPHLTRLSLLSCRLSRKGWAALGSLRRLKHLSVVAATIDGDDHHLRHLANLQRLETLRTGTYYHGSNAVGCSTPVSIPHETVEADRLFRWIGELPNLKEVLSHRSIKSATLEGLRHFTNTPALESLDYNLRIVPETSGAGESPSAREILARFDALKSLSIYVDCSDSTAESNRVVDLGDMDSLESLSVQMPEQGAECYLHDLPNLRTITLATSRQSFYDSRGTHDPSDPCFERVRFENLPRLKSLSMPIPSEFAAQDVATKPEPDPEGTREKKRPGLHATLYGLLTESVARDLASIDGLVRLDLNPQLGSAPTALEAFREHPTLCELGMRFNDSPGDWIERISALHEMLRVLELPSKDLDPHHDKSDLPLNTQTLAPLAKMTKLETLRIGNVVDPDGEPLAWVSDLPHLVDFRLWHYDMERFHIRFTNDRAAWYMGSPGKIGTVKISQWPQASTNVILDSSFNPCSIDIDGEVDHYVIRDIPHATLLRLDPKGTETVQFDGDLASLTQIQFYRRRAKWILTPTANVPPSLQLP